MGLKQYCVTISARQEFARDVIVNAANEEDAKKLALEQHHDTGSSWDPVDSKFDYQVVNVDDLHDPDLPNKAKKKRR